MNAKRLILLTLSTALCLSATAVQAKKQEFPEVTVDGLHRVPDSKLAVVYAEPGADLSPYNRVNLLEAYVAFKKNWERSQRTSAAMGLRVSARDMEKIKNSLSSEFNEVFKTALEEAGYELTDEVAEDVMIVRPAIINLDVTAPDVQRAGRSTVYAASAGEMTLYIELWDSVSGDIMAKALDRRADNSRSGFYTWTNSATNARAARRILRGWAAILVDALNEAKSYDGSSPDDS